MWFNKWSKSPCLSVQPNSRYRDRWFSHIFILDRFVWSVHNHLPECAYYTPYDESNIPTYIIKWHFGRLWYPQMNFSTSNDIFSNEIGLIHDFWHYFWPQPTHQGGCALCTMHCARIKNFNVLVYHDLSSEVCYGVDKYVNVIIK